MNPENVRLKNRDLSWLAFNHRVLQEAADPTVPLFERINFLAIWSSNLDEFFRVRVASLRAFQRLKRKTQKKLDVEPEKLLRRMLKAVTLQQEEFGVIFRRQIRRELNKQGIFLVREEELTAVQETFVPRYFSEHVRPLIDPIFLSEDKDPPFLENKTVYLALKVRRKGTTDKKEPEQYAVVGIPTALPRFLLLPPENNHHYIMFLDDVVRMSLGEIFPGHNVEASYAIKLTRDAELYIEDEFVGDLLDKVKKALGKRSHGLPSRFLYDSEMQKKMLLFLKNIFKLSDDEMVNGGRYHNFSDFFSFPNPKAPALTYQPLPPISVSRLTEKPVFDAMREGDILLHFPYHSYNGVIKFLEESVNDPAVVSLHITLYRLAPDSEIVRQLIRAAQNGKQVTAFVEVKARFDEEINIRWAEEMEKAGARVLYSIPNLKVHAKLCLVTRSEAGAEKQYAYLSTGNFNESAAKLYTDFGFLTTDERLTREVEKLFEILFREKHKAKFEHLLVPPFNMRQSIERLIRHEIKNARKGRPASIIAKMNSLEDPRMIEKLYEASNAGVKISLIIRGICCLIPGIKGMSENIEVISIIDRFLEHARIFVFHNGGDERFFLSSGDWMKRNLDRRIEVAFPIYDKKLQGQLKTLLDLQLRDNVKARVINKKLDNRIRIGNAAVKIRSQYESYEWWKSEENRQA